MAPVLVFDLDGDVILKIGSNVRSVDLEDGKISESDPDEDGKSSEIDSNEDIILNIGASTYSTGFEDGKSSKTDPFIAKVSSKHMTLASPVFKIMLGDHFTEGNTLRNEGSLTLELPDDDADAWSVVLGILHHKWTVVPLKLSLPRLVQVGILKDKYQILEFPPQLIDAWFDFLSVSDQMPSLVCPRLMDIIFVSYVFQQEQKFKKATHVAIMTLKGSGLARKLPIPTWIRDCIKLRRQTHITDITENLLSIFNKYKESETARVCNYESGPYDLHSDEDKKRCDALVLDLLTLDLQSAKLVPDLQNSKTVVEFRATNLLSDDEKDVLFPIGLLAYPDWSIHDLLHCIRNIVVSTALRPLQRQKHMCGVNLGQEVCSKVMVYGLFLRSETGQEKDRG